MIKTFARIFLMVGLAAPINVAAGPYYDLKMDVSTATMKVSGAIKVAASSSSPNVPIFDLDGAAKLFTLNSSSLSFTNGGAVAGNLLVTSSVTANYIQGGGANFPLPVTGISLTEIEDLTANKTFTMANKTLTWNFTNPTGGVNWNFTGAAAGHSLDVMQTGGNPSTDMHLLHIHAEDADPTTLHLVPGGATSRALMTHANGDTVTNPGRFEMTGAGAMAWGTGAGATDTTLARSGAGALLSNSTITAAGFVGNGAGLTNVSDDSKLPLTGGTLSNTLTLTDPAALVLQNGGEYLSAEHDSGSLLVMRNLDIDYYAPGLGYDLNISTIGTMTIGGQEKTHRLRVDGGLLATSSITANDGLYGALTGNVTGNLTGLASLNLPLTGGTLTGPLTLAGSSLTVNGAFAVQGSTFVITGGKVGVGTASPAVPLDFSGVMYNRGPQYWGVNLHGIWKEDGAQNPTFDTNGVYSFVIQTSGVEKFRITNAGSVGIGTTSPDQKLTVAGNISATGQVISSGTGSNYFAGSIGVGTTNGPTSARPANINTPLGIGLTVEGNKVMFANPRRWVNASAANGVTISNHGSDPKVARFVADGDDTETDSLTEVMSVLANGNVVVPTASAKLIMKSPDGTCSACGPDNSDAWACASVTCP